MIGFISEKHLIPILDFFYGLVPSYGLAIVALTVVIRVAIAISKKVSKKAVERNKLRRILQEWLLTNIQKINNHKPYWLLVNLKFGDFYNDKSRLLEEFQKLMFKSRLIK